MNTNTFVKRDLLQNERKYEIKQSRFPPPYPPLLLLLLLVRPLTTAIFKALKTILRANVYRSVGALKCSVNMLFKGTGINLDLNLFSKRCV